MKKASATLQVMTIVITDVKGKELKYIAIGTPGNEMFISVGEKNYKRCNEIIENTNIETIVNANTLVQRKL